MSATGMGNALVAEEPPAVRLVVPLGHDGCSMFFDVSADFCSGYTDVNGTVGYRFNF